MYDVTVIGPALIDVLAAPFSMEAMERDSRYLDQIRMSFGGDALNESAVLTRLGKKVQLISKVGADEAGRTVLNYLHKNGIDTDSVQVEKGLETAVNIALIAEDGSRKFLMNPHSSLRRLGLEDVMPVLSQILADSQGAKIVSFASMFISTLFTVEKMKELFAAVKAAGRTLVVDVTRAKNGETLEDLKDLLPYIDVFVPNDEEIASLTGVQDPAENVRILVEAGVKTAVVKIGGEGCLVGTKAETVSTGTAGTASADTMDETEGLPSNAVQDTIVRDGVRIVHVHAVPDAACIDTTGAGDTFAAGLIAGLCNGWSLPECAKLGCAAASCSIEQIGATDGVRSLDQVMERYHMIP